MKNKSAIVIDTSRAVGKISPKIYGHFAEHIGGVIYDGVWVSKDSEIPNVNGIRLDLIEKLKNISPAVIRWPGGCFAETYDWRDGIGAERRITPSWCTSKDGSYESNAFGTHEFIELCKLVNASPYIAVNTTSLPPQCARDWMDYCNSPKGTTYLSKMRELNGASEPFDVVYWGVGNENWGGGGNMTGEQYALEYRKYATVLKNLCPKSKLIAAAGNCHSLSWTKTFFEVMKEYHGTKVPIDGVSLHYYFSDEKDSCFDKEGWQRLISSAFNIENQIKGIIETLIEYGLEDKINIYVDEWGAMYDKSEVSEKKNQLFRQQVTLRDAVAVALVLNIFNKYSNYIEMANLAQLVNCLSSLFLTDGKDFITTPVYHIYNMYKEHQNSDSLEVDVFDDEISCSASRNGDKLLITIVNTSYEDDKFVDIEIPVSSKIDKAVELHCDSHEAYNDFDAPNKVIPKEISIENLSGIILPKSSVIALYIDI